jgi:hypothetical protein
MGEKALQTLKYLIENGPCRLGVEGEIAKLLESKGLIAKVDSLSNEWIITQFAKGILREVEKEGIKAMVTKMETYL